MFFFGFSLVFLRVGRKGMDVWTGGYMDVRGLENQSGFPSRHLGLEAALVKGLAHGVDGAAGASKGDEACTALESVLVLVVVTWAHCRGKEGAYEEGSCCNADAEGDCGCHVGMCECECECGCECECECECKIKRCARGWQEVVVDICTVEGGRR